MGEGQDSVESFLAAGWLKSTAAAARDTGMAEADDDEVFSGRRDGEWIDWGGAMGVTKVVVLPGGQIILGRWWSPNVGTGGGSVFGAVCALGVWMGRSMRV